MNDSPQPNAAAPTPKNDNDRQQLVFGLVGAIGTKLDRAVTELKSILNIYGFEAEEVALSDAIRMVPKYADVGERRTLAYYERMIRGGDEICSDLSDEAALADAAMAMIRSRRKPGIKTAFILRSLKRPQEIERLRGVYGGMFYAIGVFADKTEREKRLARLASEDPSDRDGTGREGASRLVEIDANERGRGGQKVSDTFAQVDCVIRSDNQDEIRKALDRFVSLVFKKPHITPTISEVAMMQAYVAGLRSADLSRQIGAVAVARDGRVLVTGCNEVPRGGGGQYWESDIDDRRDFKLGHDINDRKKRDAIVELIAHIKHLFRAEFDVESATTLYERLADARTLEGTTIDSLIEFGRVSHAEMSAITSAALGGIVLRDCDLYTTTFPCHMCTRLIIATGIRNVFYIEPYPKSAAVQMYGNGEIVVNPLLTPSQLEDRLFKAHVCDNRTHFIPFDGVAPRRYAELFAKTRSKDKKEGSVLDFVPTTAKPRRTPEFTVTYESAETYLANRWTERLEMLRQKAKENAPPIPGEESP